MQRYMLTIWDLFSMKGGDVQGGQAVIAIVDGEKEIDRFAISGKVQSPSGYCRSYDGRPGLSASLVSGPGKLSFEVAA